MSKRANAFKIKSRYSNAQLLRFPLLFGSILSVFITGFMYRRVFFREEIEAVRQKNYEEAERQQKIMDQAKEIAAQEMSAKAKTKPKT
ncbi:hypothetical protein ACOMHN_014338 [Nucella lapillus]